MLLYHLLAYSMAYLNMYHALETEWDLPVAIAA
jgi:hypothetical protein